MSKYHIYNPDFEISLSKNNPRYTPQKQIVRMIDEMSLIPLWYAKEEDFVLSDKYIDPIYSYDFDAFRLIDRNITIKKDIDKKQAIDWTDLQPWGQCENPYFRFGIKSDSDKYRKTLETVKQLTDKRTLPSLREQLSSHGLYTTKSFVPHNKISVDDIERILGTKEYVVKKAFACSGRGVLMCNDKWLDSFTDIEIERKEKKLQDFGMEFVKEDGRLKFTGISIFNADANGKYKGSIVCRLGVAIDILKQYTSYENIERVITYTEYEVNKWTADTEIEALGVDCMIVENSNRNNICVAVEVNARRTMGHVSVELAERFLSENKIANLVYGVKDNNKRSVFSVDRNNKIVSGEMSLIPFSTDTMFDAKLTNIRDL